MVASIGGASLRDCGGSGPTLLLVPSLINPPHILDLDGERSLARALNGGNRVLLLDWGPAALRRELDLTAHIDTLLLPLIDAVGPTIVLGYCLGGTLTLAAASRSRDVMAVITLASPWQFGAYPEAARAALRAMWDGSRAAAAQLGGLPMEVLQSAFWSLDPDRTVLKFARFGELDPSSREARRFIALEDWANGGEPLPLPAARELIERLFGDDATGQGKWRAGTLPTCPTLHVTAANDRIVPANTAAAGPSVACPAGHVGMVVGHDAPRLLHAPLREWLEGLKPHR